MLTTRLSVQFTQARGCPKYAFFVFESRILDSTYRGIDGKLMAVAVKANGNTFEAGSPEPAF